MKDGLIDLSASLSSFEGVQTGVRADVTRSPETPWHVWNASKTIKIPDHRPRIVLDFQLHSAWDRGVVHGIMEFCASRDWNVLLCTPNVPLPDMVATWAADVVVSGNGQAQVALSHEPGRLVLIVGQDRADAGYPSMCPDDLAIGEMAAAHLLRCGLQGAALFAYCNADFGRLRASGFRQRFTSGGGKIFGGGGFSNDPASPNFCSHDAIIAWLTALPKPCGIFALCDEWARPLATYCRHIGLRVPEDVALIGVDDDPLVCELSSPPLSSIAIPWREIGRRVVETVADHLAGRPVPAVCVKIPPLDVVIRRSTDTHSIQDAQVAIAVAWIRQNAHRVITVDDVVRAVPTYRQRLERQFRAGLGRTVMEEVRQSHLEIARTLLRTTDLPMPDVAARSGFTNATLLGVSFRKVVGQTPREYRRRSRGDRVKLHADCEEDVAHDCSLSNATQDCGALSARGLGHAAVRGA